MAHSGSILSVIPRSLYGADVPAHLAADGAGLTGLGNMDLAVALDNRFSPFVDFRKVKDAFLPETDFSFCKHSYAEIGIKNVSFRKSTHILEEGNAF